MTQRHLLALVTCVVPRGRGAASLGAALYCLAAAQGCLDNGGGDDGGTDGKGKLGHEVHAWLLSEEGELDTGVLLL